MWWHEIHRLEQRLAGLSTGDGPPVSASAIIEDGVVLDERAGPVSIGDGTRICAGSVLRGPIAIGADCLVGNHTMLRGPLEIGDGVRIGYACEVKNAIVERRATIGPLCFVADSVVEEDAYLGAMVRTSNHRLDGEPISVIHEGQAVATGREKLGCLIGARSALGIQVIVLPGRVIQPDCVFEPRLTISRNFPQGHYRVRQQVECVVPEPSTK